MADRSSSDKSNGSEYVPILSAKHGGKAVEIRNTNNGETKEVPLRTYCRFYYQRPLKITTNYLCCGHVDEETNRRLVPRCVDYPRCLRNKPKAGKPKVPYDRPARLPDKEG